MSVEQAAAAHPELPHILGLVAERFRGTALADFLTAWQDPIYSFFAVVLIAGIGIFGARRLKPAPGRLQSVLEAYVQGVEDFVGGLIGPKGRRFAPFIGTLFIYILVMNLMGLVPFLRSATANWSTTMALALCVFILVLWTALRELGFRGYVDHLMGQPRGFLAWTIVIPVFMLALHIISELIRPISLSLRLRSNVWGDDLLLTILTKFGLGGLPLLLFNTLLVIIAAIVQAFVFALLSTIYLAMVIKHDEEHA